MQYILNSLSELYFYKLNLFWYFGGCAHVPLYLGYFCEFFCLNIKVNHIYVCTYICHVCICIGALKIDVFVFDA